MTYAASMTFEDDDVLGLFDEFQRSAGIAKRTIQSRTSQLRGMARRQETSLIDATVFHMRRDIGRDEIKPSTRVSARAAMVAFYEFLAAEGLRADNPGVRLPVVKTPPHKPRPYTQHQVDLLLTSGSYARTRAMILLGAYEGLRASEIAAVHSDDVDVDAGTLKVLGKGSRTDYLPLHDTIRRLAETMPERGWWFPSPRGADLHIHGRSVSDQLTDAKRRAGITDPLLTGHSLRHFFGTELVRSGASLRVVQELMRHSSLTTTQRYVAVLDEDRRNGIALLPGREIQAVSMRRGSKAAGLLEFMPKASAATATMESMAA